MPRCARRKGRDRAARPGACAVPRAFRAGRPGASRRRPAGCAFSPRAWPPPPRPAMRRPTPGQEPVATRRKRTSLDGTSRFRFPKRCCACAQPVAGRRGACMLGRVARRRPRRIYACSAQTIVARARSPTSTTISAMRGPVNHGRGTHTTVVATWVTVEIRVEPKPRAHGPIVCGGYRNSAAPEDPPRAAFFNRCFQQRRSTRVAGQMRTSFAQCPDQCRLHRSSESPTDLVRASTLTCLRRRPRIPKEVSGGSVRLLLCRREATGLRGGPRVGSKPSGRNAMSEPRFTTLTPETMTADQKRVADAIQSGPRGVGLRGPFNALLRSPELCDHVQRLGAFVRFGTSIPQRLNEMAIIMAGRKWNAQYEFYAHRRLALEAGLSPAIADAIAANQRPASMAKDEETVYDFGS